jgi:hypothetical protein
VPMSPKTMPSAASVSAGSGDLRNSCWLRKEGASYRRTAQNAN